MSAAVGASRITEVGTGGVVVKDQNEALEFYVRKLGFDKRMGVPMEYSPCWIQVAPAGARTTIALMP